MTRYLVTGGAGFLGSAIARHLAADGGEVVVFDRIAGPDAPGVRSVVGDIRNADDVRRAVSEARPERVVHAAAVVGVRAGAAGVADLMAVNVVGSTHLFDAVVETGGVERIVDISSEETYGHFVADEIGEDAPAAPISAYGISKVAVEGLGRLYARKFGLPYVAARLSWAYGPGFPRTRLPHNWLDDAAAGRPSVMASGGDQLLDLTWIGDAVHAIATLAAAPSPRHDAYHVGSGSFLTVRELAEIIGQAYPEWQHEVGPGALELAAGEHASRKGALRLERFEAEFGPMPRTSVREGISRTIAATTKEPR